MRHPGSRSILMPLALLLLTLVLAGCGGSKKQEGGNAASPKGLSTVAEIANYNGPDRQQILEGGARKEGRLTLYTSSILTQGMRPLVDSFQARYPYVKVEIFRADEVELFKKTAEEYQAGRYNVDVFETVSGGMLQLKDLKVLQDWSSPELANYPDEAKKDKTMLPVRESYIGLGYNPNLIKAAEAPKTLDDLLSPRWKGKMSVAGSSTGVRWFGSLIEKRGEEFARGFAAQNVRVQNISGRALADLIIAGEVPLSPTIFDSHVLNSKKSGAPIEWAALEPVVVNEGSVALASKAPNPHAAMLLIDFMISEEGQKVLMAAGYGSARKGMPGGAAYQKIYMEAGYASAADYRQKFSKWDNLFKELLVKK